MASPIAIEISRVSAQVDNLRRVLEEAAKIGPESVPAEDLERLRSSIDHMRYFLWAFTTAALRRNGRDITPEMERLRMQRITEMLGGADFVGITHQEDQDRTFFQTVLALTASAMDRNIEPAV